ncbi:MAG TPA: NAD(P)-dependent oxidoreductase [Thermomicrobiales bacterium]
MTGSSGQLGAAIARLLRPEHDVFGLDVLPGPETTHLGDLADRALINTLVGRAEVVIHTASLHVRHLATATKEAFIATNIAGTQHLLTAAAASPVARLVYTSSTSVYGDALVPTDRAVWVTEDVTPQPRDIYDVTKLAAEGLCRLFHRETHIPTRCLRVGRFFPEPPDQTALYRLYRGLDPRDAAEAHRLAATVDGPGYGLYNIAARSPFAEVDAPELWRDAAAIIRRYHPEAEAFFARQGWAMPAQIDRVYVIERASRELGYHPRHNFADFLREYVQ